MTTIAAGLGALTTMKKMGMGLGAEPTELIDRGSYWIIKYSDGTFDNVPKNAGDIAQAAANARAANRTDLATKYEMWALNVRDTGKPVQLDFKTEHPVLFWGGIALGAATVLGGGYMLLKR